MITPSQKTDIRITIRTMYFGYLDIEEEVPQRARSLRVMTDQKNRMMSFQEVSLNF